jgi:glutathione S-transferase
MATPLTLYFTPASSARVSLILLEEAGLPFETRKIDLMAGQQKSPEFLAVNPKGKVPALVTPDGVLTENVAIAMWLDSVAPQASLLPAVDQAWARAQAMSWLVWAASTVHPFIYRLRMTARIHPDAATHDAIKAAAMGELQQQIQVAEDALADGRLWIAGPAFSAADVYVGWAFGRGGVCGLDMDAYPRMKALFERLIQRPAVKRALAREEA